MSTIGELGRRIGGRFLRRHGGRAALPTGTGLAVQPDPAAEVARPPEPLRIEITRGPRSWRIDPVIFETFGFQDGDTLRVLPAEAAARLPTTWGDTIVPVAPGHAIRVPAEYRFFEFRGFRIPVHLIALTGAGPDTFDWMGRRHIELYEKFVGLGPEMTLLEIGCGIGRDALQLLDLLRGQGRYIGIDVTRDSVVWCQDNITPKHPAFTFHHFDAVNELYNPYGAMTSMDFALPVADASVDRIFLASVFTHLFEDEVQHYLGEFARVLKPGGQVYASFFLHAPEALEAARARGTTSWNAKFDIPLSEGVYANDPVYPRGAVAFTDAAMRRLIAKAGLRLVRPYLKGSWFGLHADPDDGQDVAILARTAA
jgi:SAM-dependent methyltransferase